MLPTPSLNRFRPLSRQRGLSLFSMAIVAIIVGFFALMVMRAFPSINEFLTIRKSITSIMRNNPSGAAEIRNLFDKQKEVEYSIQTISGKDLEITQDGDRLRTRFAYQVEVPIIEPVYLLIKYEGEAKSSGGTP
jgi:hypothetical protein